ncbi:hypothetical protein C8R46DRAFT_1190642 [Mycena filopes]|nr:hypothetical protein C8R46DRAFT_1190642 [Mycena filopes]
MPLGLNQEQLTMPLIEFLNQLQLDQTMGGSVSSIESANPHLVFWTAYKHIADEHDKEFILAARSVLENSLIFAGLFSAVVATLISVIGDADDFLSTSVLGLLYLILSIIMSAAFFAVRGQQSLTNYQRIQTRGTIVQHGRERQRKLTAFHKHNAHLIIDLPRPLLSLSLIFFLYVLVVFVARDSIVFIVPTGSVVAVTTAIYFRLWASERHHSDSPFKNPILRGPGGYADLFRSHPKDVHEFKECGLAPVFALHPAFKRHDLTVPAILWLLQTTTEPQAIVAAARLTLQVQWNTLDQLDLHWDHNGPYAVLHAALDTLRISYMECFDFHTGSVQLRPDQVHNANLCGQAYLVFRHIALLTKAGEKQQQWHIALLNFITKSDHKQLDGPQPPKEMNSGWSLYRAVAGSPDYFEGIDPSSFDWALNTLPTILRNDSGKIPLFLEEFKPQKIKDAVQLYPRFLYTLNILLGLHLDPRDFFIQDKSPYIGRLTTTLFQSLAIWLKNGLGRNAHSIAVHALTTTAQFAALLPVENRQVPMDVGYLGLLTRLCAVFPPGDQDQWIDAIVSILLLNTDSVTPGSTDQEDLARYAQNVMLSHFPSLEEHTNEIQKGCLYHLLLNPNTHIACPSSTIWPVIQRVLELNNEDSVLMFLILQSKTKANWFEPDGFNVQPGLWRALGDVAQQNRKLSKKYVTWVQRLSDEPSMTHLRPAIQDNLNHLLYAYLFSESDLDNCAAVLHWSCQGQQWDITGTQVAQVACRLWMDLAVSQGAIQRFVTVTHIVEGLSTPGEDSSLVVDLGTSSRILAQLLVYMENMSANAPEAWGKVTQELKARQSIVEKSNKRYLLIPVIQITIRFNLENNNNNNNCNHHPRSAALVLTPSSLGPSNTIISPSTHYRPSAG